MTGRRTISGVTTRRVSAGPDGIRRGHEGRSGSWLLGLVGFALVLAPWYAIHAAALFRAGLVPTPLAVLRTLADAYRDGES